MLEATAVPQWTGPSRVFRLLDAPAPVQIHIPRATWRKPKPRRWVPWTLMTPKVEAEIAAGKWDMSNLWPFPEAKP